MSDWVFPCRLGSACWWATTPRAKPTSWRPSTTSPPPAPHTPGRTGRYLEPAPRDAGVNILPVAREGLRRELTTALHRVVTHKEPVHFSGLRVKTNGESITVQLSVQPVASGADGAVMPDKFLVALEEASPADADLLSEEAVPADMGIDGRIAVPEQELRAKEEVQSVNEELGTFNAELQAEVNDLSQANHDMSNLLAGTGVGTLFVNLQPRIRPYRTVDNVTEGAVITFVDITQSKHVEVALREARELADSIVTTVRESLVVLDEDCHVVSANRAFCRTFQVEPDETLGQVLYELGNGQWDIPALRRLLEDILPRNATFDDIEVTHEFEQIGRRTMLLNARRISNEAGQTRLMLLAIEDTTERQRAEEMRS